MNIPKGIHSINMDTNINFLYCKYIFMHEQQSDKMITEYTLGNS